MNEYFLENYRVLIDELINDIGFLFNNFCKVKFTKLPDGALAVSHIWEDDETRQRYEQGVSLLIFMRERIKKQEDMKNGRMELFQCGRGDFSE